MPIKMPNFKEFFRYLREKHGIRKSDLAKKVGVSKQYIGELEAGRVKQPTKNRCDTFVEALKLTDDERIVFMRIAFYERLSEESKTFYGIIYGDLFSEYTDAIKVANAKIKVLNEYWKFKGITNEEMSAMR
ncbi:MAG: helix-turn-helix transcriptional regulator [Candidatus Omnitrophica bacterium]|nr:helix-turn-helix transcriptional regulator [Candidatus Omnitrophota bacterium]